MLRDVPAPTFHTPARARRAACCMALALLVGAGNARAQAATPAVETPAPEQSVVPPQPSSDTSVGYPADASGDATVLLVLLIDREGGVQSAVVEAGESPFAEAAQRAALGWRFEPARRGGQAVPARIRFRVEFRQQTPAPTPP